MPSYDCSDERLARQGLGQPRLDFEGELLEHVREVSGETSLRRPDYNARVVIARWRRALGRALALGPRAALAPKLT